MCIGGNMYVHACGGSTSMGVYVGGLIVVYVHMNGCVHVEGHVCVHACGGSASR